jgi:carbonic anhydrase
MLLPHNRDYYRFSGSLTTPPCTEGVRWFVMKSAVASSDDQIAKFRSILHDANNRPTQPLNARVVLR